MEQKTCYYCGGLYKPKQNHQRYCSVGCQRKNSYRPKEYRLTCPRCKKEFTTGRSQQYYCSSNCQKEDEKERRKSNKYKENPRKNEWSIIREYVLERDDYKCKICESDINLHVHHKKFLCLGGSNEEYNLETLCSKCHHIKHYK
jgi:hypothetical protein